MENNLPDEILKKAWEKDITKEVEEARKETIAYMSSKLDALKDMIESQKRDRNQIIMHMQKLDVTKEEMEAYESDLKQKDRDISTGERLHDVLEGIILHYHRIWNKEQLSEEEQKVQRRWLLESMVFLMSFDKNAGYDDIRGLILGTK